MKQYFWHHRQWWLLGLVWLVVYGFFVSSTHVNYADSDDLLLAARFGGLAHPPGYVWWTHILHVIARLLPYGHVALVLSFVNAGVAALVVVLLALVIRELLEHSKLSSREATHIGVLTACLWGVSGMIWQHAIVMEVFAVAQALVLLTWWYVLRSIRARTLPWMAGALGMAAVLFHPLSGTAVAPAFLAVMWMRRRSLRAMMRFGVVVLAAGLVLSSAYAVMVMRGGAQSAVYSWPIASGIVGVLRFFWRSDLLAVAGSAVEADIGVRTVSREIMSLWQWVTTLSHEWGVVALGFSILGGVWWWKQHRARWWLLALVLVTGPAVILYMTLPLPFVGPETTYFWGTALRLRMLFCWQLVFGVLMAGGVAFVWEKRKAWRRSLIVLVGFSVVLTLVSRMGERAGMHYRFVSLLTRQVLHDLPEKAVLVVDSDMIFGFLYEQLVLGSRQDVIIVSPRIVVQPTMWQQLKGVVYQTESDDAITQAADIISWSTYRGLRVFLYSPDPALLSYIGGEGEPFYLAPHGYTLEVGRIMPLVRADESLALSEQLAASADPNDWWLAGLRAHIGGIHTQAAYYYARLRFPEQARTHADMALRLATWSQTKETIRATVRSAEQRFLQGGSYAVYARPLPEAYLQAAEEMATAGKFDAAWYAATRAVLVAPESSQAAAILKRIGDITGQ